MAINDRHPQYIERDNDWELLQDCYEGERQVKSKGTNYLPPTDGMRQDGMQAGGDGYKAYQAYKQRAIFHDFVSEAIEAAIGIMHRKPPTIELPEALEPLRENATINGDSMTNLLRQINVEQLLTGRLGIMLDLPKNPSLNSILPYIAMYKARDIINWDDGARDDYTLSNLNLVVLDESEYERQSDFSWDWRERYRVLVLGDILENEPASNATAGYRAGEVDRFETGISEDMLTEPQIRGQRLDQIPFVFINSKDLVVKPDDPPLLGLANLTMAIYRGEADYRQSLFLQGQDTLVITGSSDDDQVRVGTGAVLRLSNPQARATFEGVSSDGISEQRQALDGDKKQAQHKSGQLINTDSSQAESGEALGIRLAAQTATLNQVAITGAAGLEKLLKIAAEWAGANPDEVKVEPNLDFTNETFSGQELLQYTTAQAQGAPLSGKSLHSLMQRRGVTEMEYEDELKQIQVEQEGGQDNPEGVGTD